MLRPELHTRIGALEGRDARCPTILNRPEPRRGPERSSSNRSLCRDLAYDDFDGNLVLHTVGSETMTSGMTRGLAEYSI